MDFLAKIAEQKIREAIERGEFDDPAYHGKPLKLDDLSGLPAPLRMGYKILQNAGVLPPEMQLKRDIVALQDLINACLDEAERQTIQRARHEKMLRYDLMIERCAPTPANRIYTAKIRRKLSRAF